MTSFVNAAVVSGLYQSQVEIGSKQASERQNAFNEALQKVLIKLSGQKESVNSPEVYKSFFPAERFVQSFSYIENPRYKKFLETQKLDSVNGVAASISPESLTRLSSEIVKDSSGSTKAPLPFFLNVEFSAKSIDSKMNTMKLPLWGSVRPEIMLWVLIESNGVRHFLGESNALPELAILKQSASDYALPISFPKADQLDSQALNLSNLWGLFPDAIESAKSRYSANGHLMVRIYQSAPGFWSANWLLKVGDRRETGGLNQADFATISQELLGFTAAAVSTRFTGTTEVNQSNHLILDVSNVTNFKAYISVQRFLEQSNLVSVYSLESMEGDVMSFDLELKSSIDQFNEYVNLSGKMQLLSGVDAVLDVPHSNPEITSTQPLSVDLPTTDSTGMSSLSITVRKETYKWLNSNLDTKN